MRPSRLVAAAGALGLAAAGSPVAVAWGPPHRVSTGAEDARSAEKDQRLAAQEARRQDHARATGAGQRIENAYPRGIAEDTKDLSQTVYGVGVKL